MTRRRIPCTLSSRVIGPSSHSGSLGRVSTLGKIGQMALFRVHGKCQHYYESGQTRHGIDALRDPSINRSTAFTDAEKRSLGIVGLVPDVTESIETQLSRV